MGDENTLAGTTKAHKHSATSSDGGFLETSVTGMTNLSQGSIVYGDASEIVTELPIGATIGHVLTVSSGALPEWSDPAHILSPSGSVIMWAGLFDAIPSGYLLCDGSEIDRTTYADLFSAIGVQFGSTSGSTFTLPLFQNKFPRSPASSISCGATGGADSRTLTTSNMPSHTHSVNDSGHNHGIWTYGGGSGSVPSGSPSGSKVTSAINTQDNTTGITNSNTGGGSSFDNKPAYLEILFIIKT
jgi:microcystin-dependent protein